MDVQIIGAIVVFGVFGIGFLTLGIHMSLDKTPRKKIPMPPPWLSQDFPKSKLVSPEQFLNNCSSEELQELELLLGKPQYQNKIDREPRVWKDANGNMLANLE